MYWTLSHFCLWAQGGSVSFAMIPVFIVAFRWGLKGGLLSGLLFGTFQFFLGSPFIVHIAQVIFAYFIAFVVLGFAGVFAGNVKQNLKQGNIKRFVWYISLGVLLGYALRFVAHFYAGIAFFESMVDGMSVWMYSLVYNASYLVPGFILNALLIGLLFYKQPRLVVAAK